MILIILPVKNEAENVGKFTTELNTWCNENFRQDYEILYVDDGCTDDTVQILKDLDFPKVRVIRNKFDRGKGSALKTGYIMAENIYALRPDDIIVFMDSDGQIGPIEIKTFLNLMQLYQAEVVIGNKRHCYSEISYNPIRRFVSAAYNMMIRFMFGLNYMDTQCGIKIFKKEVLGSVMERVTVKNYAFDLELLVALKALKIRIVDAPVTVKKQMNAGSVNLRNISSTFADTMKVFRKLNSGYYLQ